MTQRNEPRMIAAAGLIGDTSRTFRSTGFDLGNAVGNEKWSCSTIRGYGSYPFADERTLSKSRESSRLSLIRRKISLWPKLCIGRDIAVRYPGTPEPKCFRCRDGIECEGIKGARTLVQKWKGADETAATAREIIDAEKAKQDAKTARLRKARLEKEAANLLANAPGKPRTRALKAKGGKQ